jgi:inorganic pyrophosphatase
VKLDGFGDAVEAKAILLDAIKRYEDSADKPNF